MGVDLYKGFSNPITGESFQCVSYSREAFKFNWKVKPGGYVPFEHIHLHQDEIFNVIEGELKVVVNGTVKVAGAGEVITVPKGSRHLAMNNKAGNLHCMVEYVPALDNYAFFQCFGGLTIDRDMNNKGSINIGKMLYFSKKMNAKCITRPTGIPAPLFTLAMNFFYIIGFFAGWKKQYKKYTGG